MLIGWIFTQYLLARTGFVSQSHNCLAAHTMSATPDPETQSPATAPAQRWGQRLLAAERDWMRKHLSGLDRTLWISPSSAFAGDVPSELQLAFKGGILDGDMRAPLAEWPLRDDSLDCVVIQHPLEAGVSLDPFLDEAMRVLKPECSLWLVSTGSASICRFKLARALASGLRWPVAFRFSAFQSGMLRRGGVDMELGSFAFDYGLGELSAMSRSVPWAPVLMAHARKRRSASILRPRALRSLSSAGVSGMPALPASRVGLAA
jgi:hypothetical protein